MAQPYRAELFNVDSVMDFYQNADGVHYKIFGGTSPKAEYCRYHYDGEEKEIGAQKLDEALYGLKSNIKNTNPYLIQVFKKPTKKKVVGIESQPTTQIVFQLNEPERYMPYPGMGSVQSQSDPELKMILAKIVEGQNLLISKISSEEIEEQEEKKPDFLGSILNNENFQQMAIAAISGFLTKGNNNPVALAGIPESDQQEKALKAIELISQRDKLFGDHLMFLATIPQSKYEMLLSFI